MSDHVMPTYKRLPLNFAKGAGSWLETDSGERYLDFGSGVAVNTLGHAHPEFVAALQDQVAKVIHTSNYYYVPNQEALAAELVSLSGLENVFFCSTGLEANEAAIKLARKFGYNKGITAPQIVV